MSLKDYLKNELERSMFNEVVELTPNEQASVLDQIISKLPDLVEDQMKRYVWSNHE